MNSKDRILITGAGGMVGRSLIETLQQRDFVHLLTPTSKDLDLRSPSDTESYFHSEKPEIVFHLAGRIGGIKANIKNPVEFLTENLAIGLNVINAAHRHGSKRLLYVGSSCIYPRECPQPMREEYLLSGKLEPTNEAYAIAKIAGLKLCEYFNHQYQTQYFALIPSNLFGYNDHFEPENSHVVSALMYKMHQAKISNAKSVEVWGTGNSRREFLFVEDFSKAMIHFMNTWTPSKHPPYLNVGMGSDVSIRELAELIKEIVGFDGAIELNKTAPDGMPKKLMDVSKAVAAGWKAETSLRSGLEKTYQWYQRNLHHE